MRLDGLRAIDSRKVRDYLLDNDHPTGASKARLFTGFGFSPDDPFVLEMALLRHPLDNDVDRVADSAFGRKSIVECAIRTPDRRDPCVVTVWIKESGSAAHRFVTAYPRK